MKSKEESFEMKRFIRWLIIFLAAMLLNDVVQLILAYRVYRRSLTRQAIARLRRNRRRAEKRKKAKQRRAKHKA